MAQLRRVAWILIVLADIGLLLWGAMAALFPERLLGPNSAPILAAGFEGYTKGSWPQLSQASRGFMTVLFRTYGAYGVAVGVLGAAVAATAFRRGERWAWWALLIGNTVALVSAMTYDKVVNAIGPFEMTEYLGLALVWGALAITAPFRAEGRPVPAAS